MKFPFFPLLLGTLALPAHAAQPLVCLIQPSQIAELGTSVPGVIESLRVDRGDSVRKGQVVAVLRNDVERAALDVAQSKAQADADVLAAQAAADFARQRLTRSEDLFRKQFISEQALDQVRTETQVAVQKLAQTREQRRIWERELGLARSQLAQRTLVSPIDGIVAERYLSTGERIEDRAVMRIAAINPLHVEVMVPAASFGKLRTGMQATVQPDLPDAQPVAATVKLVDKLIDGASNTFRVRLLLPNPDHALPAGARCKVSFDDAGVGTADKPRLSTQPPAARPARAAAGRDAGPSTPPSPTVLNALESWRQAWAQGDLAGYLAAYTPDFRGDSRSRAAWVRQRESRLAAPGPFRITLRDTRVEPLADDRIRVHFRQRFESAHYADDMRKSLLLILRQGKWLISEERSQP